MVIHSYRVRYGYVAGDPALAAIEQQACREAADHRAGDRAAGRGGGTLPPEASAGHAQLFTGPYQRRTIPRVGHNMPQEAPRETARAVMELVRG